MHPSNGQSEWHSNQVLKHALFEFGSVCESNGEWTVSRTSPRLTLTFDPAADSGQLSFLQIRALMLFVLLRCRTEFKHAAAAGRAALTLYAFY